MLMTYISLVSCATYNTNWIKKVSSYQGHNIFSFSDIDIGPLHHQASVVMLQNVRLDAGGNYQYVALIEMIISIDV